MRCVVHRMLSAIFSVGLRQLHHIQQYVSGIYVPPLLFLEAG